ncbi:septation ring formation regulator EzrA [Schleiferilactobacillus shenzhenensis]|uniref:septation ring formation regulator EzrA n=1 Tax=Schleiferilactobacillus shenzhenensis TaxID=1231337 RepID=UPI000689527A|nr:septation ring formation regulator EzrA [Schleiferilactobacillus shenzhenensis]
MPLWGIILIVVLVVIAVAAGVVLLRQFQNQTALAALQQRQRRLADLPLMDQVGTLAKMTLSGASLETFHRWQAQYNRLTEKEFPAVLNQLNQAGELNDHYRITQARRIVDTLTGRIADEERTAQDITDALAKITDVAQENQAAKQAAKERYKKLRKTILVQSFSFGSAITALQTALTAINESFAHVDVLESNGDHIQARTALGQINEQLDALQKEVNDIPPRVNELTNIFPGQAEELANGYDRLHDAGYRFFDINIPQELTKLDDDRQKAETLLRQNKVADLQAANKAIADHIDRLYDVMQKEIDAKADVEKMRGELHAFLTHAAVQNRTLQNEVRHLDESYVLTNDEVQTAARFGRQIAEAQERFTQDEQKIADQEAVFTLVAEDMKKIDSQLTAIEEKQVAMDKDLSGLETGEEIARQNLARFMMEFRETRREMGQQNLPGLPKQYKEFAEIVRQEIGKLDHDLNQVKINLEDITKQLIMTQEDLKTLKQRSADLIDAAALTQEILQYANALKQENPAVAKASSTATQIFNTTFDYPKALDTIATAVEAAEPGAYHRIESAYKDRKNQL